MITCTISFIDAGSMKVATLTDLRRRLAAILVVALMACKVVLCNGLRGITVYFQILNYVMLVGRWAVVKRFNGRFRFT